jgi:hypothetical protein
MSAWHFENSLCPGAKEIVCSNDPDSFCLSNPLQTVLQARVPSGKFEAIGAYLEHSVAKTLSRSKQQHILVAKPVRIHRILTSPGMISWQQDRNRFQNREQCLSLPRAYCPLS